MKKKSKKCGNKNSREQNRAEQNIVLRTEQNRRQKTKQGRHVLHSSTQLLLMNETTKTKQKGRLVANRMRL